MCEVPFTACLPLRKRPPMSVRIGVEEESISPARQGTCSGTLNREEKREGEVAMHREQSPPCAACLSFLPPSKNSFLPFHSVGFLRRDLRVL